MAAAEHPPTESLPKAICVACPNSTPASHVCTHCGHPYCPACTDWLRHVSVGEDKLRSIAPLPCDSALRQNQSDDVRKISDSESDRAKQGGRLLTDWLENVRRKLQANGATTRTRVSHTADVIQQTVAAWRDRLLQEADNHVTESTRQLERLPSRFEEQQDAVWRTCTHVSHNAGNVPEDDRKPREDGHIAQRDAPPVPELLSAEMDGTSVENVTDIINSLCRLHMTTIESALQTFLRYLETDRDECELDTPVNLISQSSLDKGVIENQSDNNPKEASYLDNRPQQCEVVSPCTDHLFIANADTVHIAEHLIDVHIRSEHDVATASGQRDCGVIQQVERVVVAQQSTTINIHVGDRPDLVQHVMIEQITDPRLVHAVDKIVVAKVSWRTEKPGATEEPTEQPRHTLAAAAPTEGEICASDRETRDVWREDKERSEDPTGRQDEKRELEVKVVSFVLKVQEAHDQLVSGLLQQMKAGKLSDVVRRLFTEFNVRLLAVDCGLGFLMDVPMAQWVEARNKRKQIQEVLSDLLPGQRRQEVEWSGIEICEPDLGESVLDHQLGQALHIKVGKEAAVAQNMSYWLDFIRRQFPERHSRTYTLPATSADDVIIKLPVVGADVMMRSAQQRVLLCLEKMGEMQHEAMMILGSLQFDDFTDEAPYPAAVSQLSKARLSLPCSSKDAARGGFELFLVSRLNGVIVCHVRTVGGCLDPGTHSEQQVKVFIRRIVKQAVHQLTLAENSLRPVVRHYAPGLAIRKVIALPYVTSKVFARAIDGDPFLLKDLGQCLDSTASPTDITAVSLFADHLSAPDEPQNITPDILLRLKEWWVRRVAATGPDLAMTSEVYDLLLARFCGPLMLVTLLCVSNPRLSLAVPEADDGEKCARITLTRQQLNLLHAAPPRLYVSGPPGTGKTVVLLLAAMEWLNGGHDVAVMVTWRHSRAASYLLHHLLQLYARSRSTAGRQVGTVSVEDLQVGKDKRMKTAVKRLVRLASTRQQLFFVADEAGPDGKQDFQTLCLSLHAKVPTLHLWAASCEHGLAPAGWQLACLQTPLRSSPNVVLAVSRASEILEGKVHSYDLTSVFRGSGPPQQNVFHKGEGHSEQSPHDCVQCGREVASCLRRLGVGVADSVMGREETCPTESGHLRFKDVFILFHDTFGNNCGMLTGLRNCQVPVKVIDERSVTDIKDVALGRSDVVRVGHWDAVRGLERRVVVFVSKVKFLADGKARFDRLRAVSRCTEHLVCVYTTNVAW